MRTERDYSREALASLLWADAAPERRRQNLRQALWRLRRIIGAEFVTEGDDLGGRWPEVASDRERFLAAVHRADADAALEQYGGAFLAGVAMPGGDEFEDWAARERRHLEEALLRVAGPAVLDAARGGRFTRARELLERLQERCPESVGAQRVAAEALLACGDLVGAREAADRLERLSADLGDEQDAATELLIERVRTAEPVIDESAPGGLNMELTGRDDVFARVVDTWRTIRGRGREKGDGAAAAGGAAGSRALVLQGVAGVGKSRLLQAIQARCASRSSAAVLVRAFPGDRELPFAFAAALARALSEVPGSLGIGHDSARELVALDPGLRRIFRNAEAAVHDSGESLRRRTLALLDLLQAVCEQQPLALLLDDLHWVDAESRRLLSALLDRSETLPLLVVAATRGVTMHGLPESRTAELPMLPLSGDATEEAIRSTGLWPGHVAADRFIALVAEHARGIPLDVMERLSLAVERGWIRLEEGAWQSPDWQRACRLVAVTSPLDHSLHDCPPAERELLLAHSVAGTVMSWELIEAMTAPASARRCAHRCRSLEERGLLRAQRGRLAAGARRGARAHARAQHREEQQRLHEKLGASLAALGDADRKPNAIRHLLQADAVDSGWTGVRVGGGARTPLRRSAARARHHGRCDRRAARGAPRRRAHGGGPVAAALAGHAPARGARVVPRAGGRGRRRLHGGPPRSGHPGHAIHDLLPAGAAVWSRCVRHAAAAGGAPRGARGAGALGARARRGCRCGSAGR